MRVCLLLMVVLIHGCSGGLESRDATIEGQRLQPVLEYGAPLKTVPVKSDANEPTLALVEDRLFQPKNPADASMMLGLDTFDSWPDGRLVLLDASEGRFVLADPADGSLREGGRFGQGPGEFQKPITIAAREDGFTVFERLPPRLIRFNRDGLFEDAVPVQLQGDGAVMRAVSCDGNRWLVQVRLLGGSAVRDVVEVIDAAGESTGVLYRGPGFTLADKVLGKPGVGITFDGSGDRYILAPREVSCFRLILIPGIEADPVAVESDWEPVPFPPDIQNKREEQLKGLATTTDYGDAFRYRAAISQVVMDGDGQIWCLIPAGETDDALRVLSADGRSILVQQPLSDFSEPLMRASGDGGVWILDRSAPFEGIQKLAHYHLWTL